MSQHILITGGAGFIGMNLSLKLLEKGYKVTILDNLHSQVHGNHPEETSWLFQQLTNGITFIKGDVTQRADWQKAIRQVDSIVHLAAETGTGQSMEAIDRYSKVNIGGTSLLMDVLANERHEVKKIIVASSRAVYGEGRYYCDDLEQYVYPPARKEEDMAKGDFEVKLPELACSLTLCSTDEQSTLHPSSFYGITKQYQEQMIMTMCPTMGIAPVALRFQNVYGPGQSLQNAYTGILSIFSSQLLRGAPIDIYEDGQESRDFIYIDDAVNAILLALEKKEANQQVYNIGTGKATTVFALGHQLKTLFKETDTHLAISGNYRVGDVRHNYADITKISIRLGFMPKVSLDEGMKKYVDWVRQEEGISA